MIQLQIIVTNLIQFLKHNILFKKKKTQKKNGCKEIF